MPGLPITLAGPAPPLDFPYVPKGGLLVCRRGKSQLNLKEGLNHIAMHPQQKGATGAAGRNTL